MIITLITGEKVRVKESIDVVSDIREHDKLIELHVSEVRIVEAEYKTIETIEYFTINHIVRYQP